MHANSAAEHGIALSVIGGIVFLVLGFGLSGVFVGAFGAEEEVAVQAVQYSHIAVGLSIFVMISMMCEKVQQSTGNMIIPMTQGLTGAIVNIILDPLMIFGIGPFPEMGVTGAALATVIGQICGMLIGLWGVFKHQKLLQLNMRKFKWRLQTVKDIYRVGLPGIVMQSITSVMTAGMNGILIGFSQTAVNVLAFTSSCRPLCSCRCSASIRARCRSWAITTARATASACSAPTALRCRPRPSSC